MSYKKTKLFQTGLLILLIFLILATSAQAAGYRFIRTWGTSGTGDGQFKFPVGVSVDLAGNVYVADNGNNRVQKFTSTGDYLTKWDSKAIGVSVDSARNVYVATLNNLIQKFTSTGDYVTQWGTFGIGDGQFSTPYSVSVDLAGFVYVADNGNNRIQKFTNTGGYVTQWGTYGIGDGQFSSPSGVSVDSAGFVYVADTGNHRIQKFTGTGDYVTQWGSMGSGNGQFQFPVGVSVDSTGNVYVTDSGNRRIQKFTGTGGYVTQWGSMGSGNGQFQFPFGVSVDSTGNVYVADFFSNRIQVFEPCIDCTPPAITAPGDVRAEATGPLTTVTIGTATATDDVDPEPTITNDAPASYPPGVTTVTWTATDDAGNSATATQTVTINYHFTGFFQPVDNNFVLNSAIAGQVIPLKWRLQYANSAPVMNLASVEVNAISLTCPLGVTLDQIEEYAAGSSGFQNLGNGYYQFNWQTPTAYANSCKTLKLNIGDGTPQTANFQFLR